VVLETTKEQLGLLGVDPDHPTGIVEVFAPVSGTITDQEITNQSAVQSYTAPNPFTISDLSQSGSSAMCGRTTWRRFISANMRTSIWRLSGPGSEGADQQHSADRGPDHSHREGPPGSGESRSDAARDVRHRDVPRRNRGKARDRAVQRDSAPARPGVGLHASRKRPLPAPGSRSRGICCPTTCRRSSAGSSRATRLSRTLWSSRTRWNSEGCSK
jgi:hypothetical protein